MCSGLTTPLLHYAQIERILIYVMQFCTKIDAKIVKLLPLATKNTKNLQKNIISSEKSNKNDYLCTVLSQMRKLMQKRMGGIHIWKSVYLRFVLWLLRISQIPEPCQEAKQR